MKIKTIKVCRKQQKDFEKTHQNHKHVGRCPSSDEDEGPDAEESSTHKDHVEESKRRKKFDVVEVNLQ